MECTNKRISLILITAAISVAVSILIAYTLIDSAGWAEKAAGNDANDANVKADAISGFTQYADNVSFKLMADETEGVFYVEDIKNGTRWYSSPEERESDKQAKGKLKMDMFSSLLITYADPAKGTIGTTNSYTGSIRNNALKILRTPKGACFLYSFPDEGFEIPLYIELNEKGFSARIPLNEVKESNEARLYEIAMLPYLGAGSKADDGYIFIPDGSGAIINFNNEKHVYSSYQQKVYGRDMTYELEQNRDRAETVRLPVFGIKRNNSGLFAIIADGDGLAAVNADVAGKKTGYNNVFASFSIRGIDTYKMGQNLGIAVKVSNIFQKSRLLDNNLEIVYATLGSDNNGFAGMAAACRDYYEEKGFLKKRIDGSSPVFLELLGGIEKKEAFMGLPVNRVVEMTTYDEAYEILEKLYASGVESIYLKYNNWSDEAIREKPQGGMTASKALGGRSRLERLIKASSELGTVVFLNTDITRAAHWGGGYTRWNSGTRTVSQTQAIEYTYDKATYFMDNSILPRYLIKPDKFKKMAEDLCNGTKGLKDIFGAGISADGLADILYSDFNKKSPINRQQASNFAGEALNVYAGDKGVLVSGGNAYAFPAARAVIDAPMSYSRFDIEDEQVPFYQMVLHGYISYSGSAINLSDDPHRAMLTALETGAMLRFYLAGDNNEKLLDTKYDDVFSIDANTWGETVSSLYKEVLKADALVSGSKMTGYRQLAPGVTCTEYEEEALIYVNKTNEDFFIQGIKVPAQGFNIIGGKR